jgi:hypothetical protein
MNSDFLNSSFYWCSACKAARSHCDHPVTVEIISSRNKLSFTGHPDDAWRWVKQEHGAQPIISVVRP